MIPHESCPTTFDNTNDFATALADVDGAPMPINTHAVKSSRSLGVKITLSKLNKPDFYESQICEICRD